MNLEKRIEELEQRSGAGERTVMCIAFVGCDGDKPAGEREIRYPVVGYRAGKSGQVWRRRDDESPADCLARAVAEVVCNLPNVAAIFECHSHAQLDGREVAPV